MTAPNGKASSALAAGAGGCQVAYIGRCRHGDLLTALTSVFTVSTTVGSDFVIADTE